MDETPGMREPRAAGRRYVDLPDVETPRFSLDGADMTRYIPDPTPETIKKATEASLKVTTLPHIIHKERVAVIAALKAQGYMRKDIAAVMGMTPRGIDWCLREARKRGILTAGMVEAAREIDEEAIPRAVETSSRRSPGQRRSRHAAGIRPRAAADLHQQQERRPRRRIRPWRSSSISCCRTARRRPESAALQGKILGTGKA
jgi:hypothetical protein